LYCCSSTTFGSIITNRSWSGVNRNSSDAMIVLMHTDFPEPVEPAMSTCGMSARSAMIGTPYTSLPSANGMRAFDWRHSSDSSRSRMMTFVLTAFGTSTPTEDLPGTGASTFKRSAFSAAAMLFVRPAIFSSFTPGAGCSSYRVIVGPFVMSPGASSIPNCASVCTINRAFATNSSLVSVGRTVMSGGLSRSIPGGW